MNFTEIINYLIGRGAGKCWGCGHYINHPPSCPSFVFGASKYLHKRA